MIKLATFEGIVQWITDNVKLDHDEKADDPETKPQARAIWMIHYFMAPTMGDESTKEFARMWAGGGFMPITPDTFNTTWQESLLSYYIYEVYESLTDEQKKLLPKEFNYDIYSYAPQDSPDRVLWFDHLVDQHTAKQLNEFFNPPCRKIEQSDR